MTSAVHLDSILVGQDPASKRFAIQKLQKVTQKGSTIIAMGGDPNEQFVIAGEKPEARLLEDRFSLIVHGEPQPSAIRAIVSRLDEDSKEKVLTFLARGGFNVLRVDGTGSINVWIATPQV